MFSDLLGITFDEIPSSGIQPSVKAITEHAERTFEEVKRRVAISPVGLELMEFSPAEKEGVLSFHFKVSGLEQAKAEMEKKGIRLLAEMTLGSLKEAICSPDDLHGARLELVEYETPTVMEAILPEGI